MIDAKFHLLVHRVLHRVRHRSHDLTKRLALLCWRHRRSLKPGDQDQVKENTTHYGKSYLFLPLTARTAFLHINSTKSQIPLQKWLPLALSSSSFDRRLAEAPRFYINCEP